MKLDSMVNEFFDAGREALSFDDPDDLHAFRIAAKHLRYTIELLNLGEAEPMLERLKAIQSILGNMNDNRVAADYLQALPSLSPEAAALPQRLSETTRHHIGEFQTYWKSTFDAPGQRGEWLRLVLR